MLTGELEPALRHVINRMEKRDFTAKATVHDDNTNEEQLEMKKRKVPDAIVEAGAGLLTKAGEGILDGLGSAIKHVYTAG